MIPLPYKNSMHLKIPSAKWWPFHLVCQHSDSWTKWVPFYSACWYIEHFVDDVFKFSFLHGIQNVKISLRFVPKFPINNNPALVKIMAWCLPCRHQAIIWTNDGPHYWSTCTHIYVTRSRTWDAVFPAPLDVECWEVHAGFVWWVLGEEAVGDLVGEEAVYGLTGVWYLSHDYRVHPRFGRAFSVIVEVIRPA